MTLRFGTLRFGIALLFTAAALAQTAPAQSEVRRFETADVRVSKSRGQDADGYVAAGRAEFKSIRMLDLIQFAYGIAEEDQVAGGPAWIATDRFDIAAQAPAGTPDSDLAPMMQTLLADRFGLQVHREDRPTPVYVLTVSKKGKLKESASDAPSNCEGRGNNGQQTLTCHMTMADFAVRIRGNARAYFDRAILDQTGLKGPFDFTISWTARGRLGNTGDEPSISIFEALDKQLGLKAELQNRPVSVLVVDKVNQKPTDDPAEIKRPAKELPTEFEVASIKPTRPDAPPREPRITQSGQLDLPGGTLMDLITTIYDVEEDMIVGAPDWLKKDKFDVLAKATRSVPFDTLKLMMRKLLEERFGLKIHTDNQPVRVYALTATRNLKMKESAGTGRATCRNGANGGLGLTCQYIPMSEFVLKLRNAAPAYLDHPTIDETGLTGVYDLALNWIGKGRLTGLAAAAGRSGGGDGAAPAPPSGAPADPGGMSLFEAVEKQLGLKLTLTKHTMPVIVIDHINRTPTEN